MHMERQHPQQGRVPLTLRCILFFALLILGAWYSIGCSKPADTSLNFTNSFVTVVSINDNKPFQSDVLTDGFGSDDVVTVNFKSESWVDADDPTVPRTSPLNTVLLNTYHVTHQRSDGGPNPSDFTTGMNLTIPIDSEAAANVVLVRAFDKHRSPLEELRDDGEMFTTSVITFYGEDGYGNDVSVSTSIAISFANFPDSDT